MSTSGGEEKKENDSTTQSRTKRRGARHQKKKEEEKDHFSRSLIGGPGCGNIRGEKGSRRVRKGAEYVLSSNALQYFWERGGQTQYALQLKGSHCLRTYEKNAEKKTKRTGVAKKTNERGGKRPDEPTYGMD